MPACPDTRLHRRFLLASGYTLRSRSTLRKKRPAASTASKAKVNASTADGRLVLAKVCPLRLAACQNPLAISSDRHHSMKLFRKKKGRGLIGATATRSIPLYRPSPLSVQQSHERKKATSLGDPSSSEERDDGNQTSPDGTKQMILYNSLRAKSSGPVWCRYQTIASPTGFSVLITVSGGTG